MGVLKQALFFEFLFQLFESHLKRTQSDRFHEFNDDLVIPPRLIHTQPAPRDDFHAVFGAEFQVPVVISETGCFQLGMGVLEREVQVP